MSYREHWEYRCLRAGMAHGKEAADKYHRGMSDWYETETEIAQKAKAFVEASGLTDAGMKYDLVEDYMYGYDTCMEHVRRRAW